MLTWAAAFLIRPIARMNARGKRSGLIWKFCDRACASGPRSRPRREPPSPPSNRVPCESWPRLSLPSSSESLDRRRARHDPPPTMIGSVMPATTMNTHRFDPRPGTPCPGFRNTITAIVPASTCTVETINGSSPVSAQRGQRRRQRLGRRRCGRRLFFDGSAPLEARQRPVLEADLGRLERPRRGRGEPRSRCRY